MKPIFSLIALPAFAQEIKTFGRIDTQEIISLQTDEAGDPKAESLKPAAAPDDWTAPVLIPLVKLPKPAFDPLAQKVEPKLVWKTDKVERDWEIVPLNAEESATAARKTWKNAQAFMAEFSLPEIGAIANSADQNVKTVVFILSNWQSEVWSDDLRVIGGLDALQSAGIISAERRSEILAKWP